MAQGTRVSAVVPFDFMHSAGAAQSPQPVSAVTAAFSPAAVFSQGTSQHTSPPLPGWSNKGKGSGTSAAGSPAPVGQIQGGPRVSAAGSKRKADQIQHDDPLQVNPLVLQGLIVWLMSHEDGTCMHLLWSLHDACYCIHGLTLLVSFNTCTCNGGSHSV